ncbi:MAG: hypothetical protein ABIF77_01570, partial [bacterium]
HYLFAIQTMDTTGAVSIDREYGRNVVNTYVDVTMTPVLTIHEFYLGTHQATGQSAQFADEIAQGQPVNFSWMGDASHYGGEIDAYRWGWDLVDPDDPNDPGWNDLPGLTPEHLGAPEIIFSSGIHMLTVHCWDTFNQLTRVQWSLEVIPVPSPQDQLPLLLVDDVNDKISNAWPASDGTPLDRDEYRDAFWEDVLTGSGGVAGFSWSSHVMDTEEELPGFRDLVNYRSVIWTSRYSVGNHTWMEFKPAVNGRQPYQWLISYQQHAGNLLLAGSRVMNLFIEEKNWMIPWIFDTDEEIMGIGPDTYYIGFGEQELPDGSTVLRGTQRYPYAGMGLAMLDMVTPRYNVYGQIGMGSIGNYARSAACSGVKALLLDGDFKTVHAPSAIPDTMFTETTIDWRDLDTTHRDELGVYAWGKDEIYDGNISDRTTPWSPQQCGADPCAETMFRIYSRFDWVDDLQNDLGNPDWPAPFLADQQAMLDHCGDHSFAPDWRTRTTGHVLGIVSHKHDDTKPVAQGDVLWGFDPYRFDHEAMRGTIHWVLGDHFGLALEP